MEPDVDFYFNEDGLMVQALSMGIWKVQIEREARQRR